MLPCNCGAIPRDLVASELFGHRKGAFTGANEDKMGFFELASGGTVVLDEIGDMPVGIQVSLLRVLQERKFQRVGDEYEFRDLDVRIISVTNRDILQEIKAGRFRRDLYYRLNGFHIFVPPLREHLDDIPLLAEHFYQKACQELDKELGGFAPEAIDMLTSYSWPGNVRELQNEIKRACMLAQKGSRIQTYHLSPEITEGESLAQEIMSERLSYRESVKQFRRQLVEQALQECNGNRTQAARLLGMGRSNLIHLIKDLNLDE
jgi:DNA-binding NtrC family response regulator